MTSFRFGLKASSTVRYALTCTLAIDVQLFSDLGLYSGIFAMYLRCQSERSGTALILFYAVCLLYVLSAVTFVSDLVSLLLYVSNNSFCKNDISISVVQTRVESLSLQLQIDSQLLLFRISIIQTTANGCCDFLAQCILVCLKNLHLSSFLLT